jgi:hypothetical protein
MDMSRNIIFVLMYHCHKLLDLIYFLGGYELFSLAHRTFIMLYKYIKLCLTYTVL